MNTLLPKHFFFAAVASTALALSLCVSPLFAYNVSHLTANYSNGQVFIAWQCPNATNLKYNLYRSKTQITSADQLTSANYVGYVRDSSSKNFRRSRQAGTPVYLKWQATANPLGADKGLYVITCTEEASVYYAVTVTDLSTGIEDRTVTSNKTSLINPVQEHIADPQPVWQDSVVWSSGDVAQMYVLFGNNQDLTNMPAFNNCGSYHYNFYVIKRGSADHYPLFVFYEGLQQNSLVGNGLDAFADVTNCYIMGMDDWIPYPDGTYTPDAGKTTSWIGYHQNYDIYSSTNPTPTSGIVKVYTQRRMIYTINWGRKYLSVDTTKLYLVGVSTGGYGVLVTANLIPEKIAAVYSVVEPVQLESDDGWHDALWGTTTNDLKCDVPDPLSPKDTLHIFDLMNIKYMMQHNVNRGMPVMYSVHGKKDNTIGWKDKPGFYDTAQISLDGGVYFWDQREHDGSKANFLDSETMPDFYSYATNLSFPAFTNCSADDDPGTGKKNDGDASGTINGYMNWDTILDNGCYYSIHLFLKDAYEGGVLTSDQYSTVTTDVTLRRLQKFKVKPGTVVYWNNYDDNNAIIQSGSFTMSTGPITLHGITVNKSGNKLELKYGNCNHRDDESSNSDNDSPFDVHYSRTQNGWLGEINSPVSGRVFVDVINSVGQLMDEKILQLNQGVNHFELELPHNGVYMVRVMGNNISRVTKLTY